ncbi:MAG: 3-phosphoshikimate 1-carboxyvinyltransferase [Acidimicrobiales bacterium]
MTGSYSVTPIARPFDAIVRLPGSKSITNRALLAGALAGGRSRLDGALFAEDTEAMMRCLSRLGAGLAADEPGASVTIDGVAGELRPGPVELDAGQAGTTARFLLPVLAAGQGAYLLDGDAQLRRRPMGPGLEALRSMGVAVEDRGVPGHLPVVVHGRPSASAVTVSGDVSSQFVSGLLLAAPRFPHGLTIELTTGLVSRPYVDLTAAVMAAFGVDIDADAEADRFVVRRGGYTATAYPIEPDASAASYFLAAAAICGGRVAVPGLGRGSRQGDVAFADLLGRMGATVAWEPDGVSVNGRTDRRLTGIEADLSDVSDTAPTLAVVAAFADSPTRVTGIGFIRAKETDRIAAVVRELRRCGVDADEEVDGFVVRPRTGTGRVVGPAVVQPDGDHRIAMAFAVMGLRAPGISIADPGCVAKTFPGFWTTIERLGR